MDNRSLLHQRLDVYVVAREIARLVHEGKIRDAELRDQAERASKSTFLALSEGLPHFSRKMRLQFFHRAHASHCELAGALDLAGVLGAIDPARLREIEPLLVRGAQLIRALLW